MTGQNSHLTAIVFAIAMFVSVLSPTHEAWAFDYAYIRGHVYDMMGNPLPAARLSSPTRETYSDPDGAFELGVSNPGCWYITASTGQLSGAYYETRREICVLLGNAEDEDFRVPYYIYGGANPAFLNSAEERVVEQWIMIYCLPEFCSPQVHVYRLGLDDYPWAEGEFVGTFDLEWSELNPEGFSIYQTDIPIPAGMSEGQYRVERESRNPETDERQSGCIFDRCWNWFVIDNTPPALGPGSPDTWWSGSDAPLIRIPFDDVVGISSASLHFTLDGRQLDPSEYLIEGDRWEGAVVHQAQGLTEGNHTVSVSVIDRAGNSSSLDFSFVVDTVVPIAVDPSPTGTVTTPSPKISAVLSDAGFPHTIDPSSIRLLLSNGVLSNDLDAVFDHETGIVYYEIPQDIRGVQLGEFPLFDGDYTVSLHFSDFAQNAATLSWHFSVRSWLH